MTEEHYVIGGARVSVLDEPARPRVVRAARVVSSTASSVRQYRDYARVWVPRHLSVVVDEGYCPVLLLFGVLPEEDSRAWFERTAVPAMFCDNVLSYVTACFGTVPVHLVREDARRQF